MSKTINIDFSQGTLLVDAPGDSVYPISKFVRYDERVKCFRARAIDYAPIILTLHHGKIPYNDNARDFAPVKLEMVERLPPHQHQKLALEKWHSHSGRGVVVMPTGSGKSYFAMMVTEKIARSTLVVVPTLDLMEQWSSLFRKYFKLETGMLGGGSKDIREITITTYDSAVIHMEFIGNRFGLVIFDECHHLPGPVNRTAAQMCLAPYRLGLTATPEREDDDSLLYRLIGPLVFRVDIRDLEGGILAAYQTKRICVSLDEDEAVEYERNRHIYTEFLREHGIYFRHKNDWQKFIALCARLPAGRDVFKAYMTQKRIARGGRAKFRAVWELFRKHRGERIILFTADNDTAYELGSRFFLPVITHKTKIAERKHFLDRFRSGEYPILVTSKVLNEGVDVPEASVGIVVSGSGSIREHVQRLGRILRSARDKQAVLYEVISDRTSEYHVSERRRKHSAYQRSATYKKNQ